MEEERYNSDIQEEQQNTGSNIHNILLRQREKLAKNAKKKKRIVRQKWFVLFDLQRQRRLILLSQKLHQTRNKKIEQICENASNFVISTFSFDNIIRSSAENSNKFFRPLKNIETKDSRIPTREELVESIALRYMINTDLSSNHKIVAEKASEKINKIADFELIHKDPNPDDYDDEIASRAVENMPIVCAPIDSKKETKPLLDFSQDAVLFSNISSIDAIAGVAARLAVTNLGIEKKALEPFDSTVLPQMRPFLRLAFPRWDNEVELTLDRGDTLEPDSITTFFNEKPVKKSDPLFLDEAKEMLGDENELIDEFSKSVLPLQIIDSMYDAIGIEDLLDGFPEEPAELIANDPDQSVKHSMTFIDEELNNGLVEFCADHIGVNEAVFDITNMQMSLLKQNIANRVSMFTFDKLSTVVPFLKGAADAKRHKMENEDALNTTRRWKDEMMNKIKQFLD